MIIHLQQDGCFTGQSGHGGLKLITSIINYLQEEAGARTLEHLHKEGWLVISRTDVQDHQVSWWWPWLCCSEEAIGLDQIFYEEKRWIFACVLRVVNLGLDLLNSDNTLSLKMAPQDKSISVNIKHMAKCTGGGNCVLLQSRWQRTSTTDSGGMQSERQSMDEKPDGWGSRRCCWKRKLLTAHSVTLVSFPLW